ncbi:MAG TPA: hypothetical protein VG738_09325 [Chitinophagaceae bacterium]|nr:hypothetical protein [Chitinophagaceae bacterium]
MKLLFVTCLKEDRQQVADLFKKAKISVFSATHTTGFKDDYSENLGDNWFGAEGEEFDSVFLYSFTSAEKADKALLLIQDYNDTSQSSYPIRAFIIPVEGSSYQTI